MKIIIIAALGNNNAIGKDSDLPWGRRQRGDMLRFFRLTKGFPIITGRKTYESFPQRPLRFRTNIVITRQSDYGGPDGLVKAGSFEEAIEIAKREGKEKAFIIGGAKIYKLALSQADKLYITFIHHEFEADTFFPVIDPSAWQEIGRSVYPADADNAYPYSFVIYDKI